MEQVKKIPSKKILDDSIKTGLRDSNPDVQIKALNIFTASKERTPPKEAIIMDSTAKTLFVVFLADKSGSMRSIRQSTIQAINEFISKQQKEPKSETTILSLFLFNETVERLWSGVAVDKVERLSNKTYNPMQKTALLDAIGESIIDTDTRISSWDLASKSEPASTKADVLLVVLTDSLNNHSIRYGFHTIHDMIRQRLDKNWEFLWMGPNRRSQQYALDLGIPFENTEIFPVTDVGIHESCRKISDAVSRKKRFNSTKGWKGDVDTKNKSEDTRMNQRSKL